MSIDKKLRPHFHITGGEGWINDPNGLVYYRGKYHAFYQYYPEATHWGPMHWGHAVSGDLTHWETLAPALYPDENDDGCFSGSALVWQDKLWLLYTSFTENGGGENIRQRQALAVSEDGVHFEKLGVVIGENDLPEGYSPCDFRDPKMWKKDDAFYCVVAAKKIGGKGRILLYTSEDLKKWRFVGDLFGKDSKGEMIECPDYIEDKGLLLCCEQFQPAEGKTHLNIHTARYYTGTLDYATGRFTAKNEGIADYGFDFYAPQTFSGANAMIAWLNMWDRSIPSEKYGFAGMLTVPRALFLENGELLQKPIINGKTALKETGKGGVTISDRIRYGALRFSLKKLRSFTAYLRAEEDRYTKITLENGEWIFDRSGSGEKIEGRETDEDSLHGIRRMPFADKETTEIEIVLDEFSVEFFSDGKSLSSTIYPDPSCEDGSYFMIDAEEYSYEKITV